MEQREKYSDVEISEVIKYLEDYNLWRRGDDYLPQPQPRELGRTIDMAIEMLKEL